MKKKEQTMKIKIHEATLNQNLVGDEIICSIIKPMKPIPPDPFVRQSQLDKALKDVVRRSDLDEALKPYVTKADLKEALKPFVTRDELKAELAKKPA
ncbi:hypothetical protein FACS1894166_00670 [Bacilli bacterium]|nr:hypothetical protein FACS1894166_00670 [Bacilli bacterium]